MQITKFLPAAAAAAVCILPLSVPAQDTDAQIKAREAMRQKLNELQTTAPQVSPQPTNPAPRAPKAPKSKAPAAPKPPPVQTQPAEAQPAPAPATAPAASDSESISKARDAMRQKMKEAMKPQVVTPPPNQQNIPTLPARTAPAPVSAPEPAVKPAPAAVTQAAPVPVPQQAAKPAPTPAPVQAEKSMPAPTPAAVAQSTDRPTLVLPPSADPESLAKAREAMRAKMSEVEGSQPAPNMAAHPGSGSHDMAQTHQPAKHIAHSTAASFQPIEGPALPYSASKKEQLDELLRKYRADELTPEQYHQQRAKILAQP